MPVDWVKHFKLTGNPFNTIPLQTKNEFESLLVRTDDFVNQIDPLINYFESSPPFLRVIAAPRGSGKSTILHYISQCLKSKQILTCFVTHQPSITKGIRDPVYGIGNDTISKITADLAEALLGYVQNVDEKQELLKLLKQLELTTSGNVLDTKSIDTFSFATNQKKLERLLNYLKLHKIHAFLAIDNYDKLDRDLAMEFLRSNLSQPLFEALQASGLSIVLVMKLELHGEIGCGDLSYLGKPIILNALNPLEASSLINKRLTWKSTEKREIFDEMAIARITIREEGIPRNILETSRLCMAKAAERHYDSITGKIVQEILRTTEKTASEYYKAIKQEPVALSGLLLLSGVAKECDPDTFRTMLQALLDISEDRLVSPQAEEQLRKHRLLFLSEKTIDFARKKGCLAPEVQVLLNTIEKRFPLNIFMDWFAAGEPAFTFVPSSEEQKTDSTIEEQFSLIISAFKREDLKLTLRNAYTAYKAWNAQIEQGDYNVTQLLSDMWASFWGLGICAYYADKIAIEKRADINLPNYNELEAFLLSQEETRNFVPDFANVHQNYLFAEKGVIIDRALIEGLYARILSVVTALLEVSLHVLTYLKELGIPLPSFKVREAQELERKLSPYLRGETKYILQTLSGVSTSDFLMLSWIERNFIFSYLFGKKTYEIDLDLDLYQCQPNTLCPQKIPEFITRQLDLQKLSGGVMLGFYNSLEFSASLVKMAKNNAALIKIFSKKNTVDIGLSLVDDSIFGSVYFSAPKFGQIMDITNINAFSEIKTVKRPPTLFLSYSSQDKEFAQKLAYDLKNNEVDVWIDFWEIKVGDSIIEKISTAIQENDFIGVVLTPASCNSAWVRKELAIGIIKELEEKRVVLLPLLAKSCAIPPIIRDKHYANFVTDYKEGLIELVCTLKASCLKW